jgi:hypothetical protein
MIPVRTRASNFVYKGPSPDIGDAWVERRPSERAVMLTWQPSDEERAAIAAGALVELGIYGQEPIPPVSVNVSAHTQISAIAASLRDRAMAELRRVSPAGPGRVPPGYWAISDDVWDDVWDDLQASEALDPADGVPTLFGRPLVRFPEPQGSIEYVAHEPPTTTGRFA